MKRQIAMTAAISVALGWAATAGAHHSFAAEFDINEPITLSGTLTEMEWVNPHGWLQVAVTDAKGKMSNWSVEAVSPNALLRRGLRKTDFPIDAKLLIEGYQAKDGSLTANATSVKFEDGRNFFVGSSGTGAPEPKTELRPEK